MNINTRYENKINHYLLVMEKSLMIFMLFLFTACTHSHDKTDVQIVSDQSLQQTFDTTAEKPYLIVLKNDSCDLCTDFRKYIESNKESLNRIDINAVHYIAVNSVQSENMWLFHILQKYGFPTTIYVNEKKEMMNIFEGSNLYRFSAFLDTIQHNLNPSKLQTNFKENWVKIDAYNQFLKGNTISEKTIKQITLQNAKRPTFMGILLEGLYYKQNNTYPERRTAIFNYLSKAIGNASGFYEYQTQHVKTLIP